MLVIGATTALFMGLLGIVQNDIKRVVAYSTLSQLGYMTVALGVSAYAAAIFHLMTHAFFKALLFLGAGSVIIAHAPRAGHAQDGRPAQVHADHLRSRRWIGSLALIGTPFFAGFFSKDAIIEAVQRVAPAGRGLRLLRGAGRRVRHRALLVPHVFMTFHGEERFRQPHARDHDARHDAHADEHDRRTAQHEPRPRTTSTREPHEIAVGRHACR